MPTPVFRKKTAPAPSLVREKLQRRIRELEDENVTLRKQLDRQMEKYQRLIDKTIHLVFGDLKND